MKKGLFVICMASLFATSCTQTGKTEEDRFIEDLLGQMTLEENCFTLLQFLFFTLNVQTFEALFSFLYGLTACKDTLVLLS